MPNRRGFLALLAGVVAAPAVRPVAARAAAPIVDDVAAAAGGGPYQIAYWARVPGIAAPGHVIDAARVDALQIQHTLQHADHGVADLVLAAVDRAAFLLHGAAPPPLGAWLRITMRDAGVVFAGRVVRIDTRAAHGAHHVYAEAPPLFEIP